ncbi:MAG: transcriptional regulator [Methanobacteriaceae archaeon]|jgi:sugar-specific transcriptional regulator TrmB|nr:transcriptional regulator [Methanobacteriaceae archaeon]
MENKNIETLKKLGLTTYESIVYLTLNYLVSGKAIEISEHSKVPRSKVYDVLKSLHEKNFIEIERSRPIKYSVIPPKEVFKREKKDLIYKLNQLELELNEIYEDQISQVQAPMWLIHGEEKIINKELEIISRSKKSINLRIGFLFKGEIERLNEIFNKKSKISINVLASPKCYVGNKKVEISNYFNQNNVFIKTDDIPQVKMIIRDENELLHIYSKFSKNKKDIIPNTSIGVWNQYEDIAKNYNERFMMQMKKLNSISNKNKNN